MKKVIYILAGILLVLVILIFTGRKSVHHEIVIEASRDKVWSVLTDMKEYDQWNPVMLLVDGEVDEGQKVTYQFTQDAENVSKINAKVLIRKEPELLNQKGGIPLVLTFNHRYSLLEEGKQTRVIIHEDYTGIGVNFWNPEAVGLAYGRLNEALKNRVESLNE